MTTLDNNVVTKFLHLTKLSFINQLSLLIIRNISKKVSHNVKKKKKSALNVLNSLNDDKLLRAFSLPLRLTPDWAQIVNNKDQRLSADA